MLNLTQRTNNSVQLPEEVDKALFLNDEGKLVLKDQDGVIEEVNTGNNGGGASYLVYTALLTQTDTDAPVATVLENTLGGEVVWTYEAEGTYTATLTGAFTENKTYVYPGSQTQNFPDNYYFGYQIVDEDNITFLSMYSGGNVDYSYSNTAIEIRVYP
jgi:hypothetical protein